MNAPHVGPAPCERDDLSSRFTVQILLDLKNSDPTALTAFEAIRRLLGFGERLVEIRRRSLHELTLRSQRELPGDAALSDLLSAYLEQTVVFWNPNKQLAWVRIYQGTTEILAWQMQPGAQRTP
jgi:hypothetical protein